MAQITKLTADHYAKSGLALFNKHLLDASLACFLRAIETNHQEPGELRTAEYAYLAGHVLGEMKRYEDAIVFLEKAWTLDNNYAAPVHRLANIYVNLREFDSAEAMFEVALKLASKAGGKITDIALDTSLFKLFVGRYVEGFQEFEVRKIGREGAYVDSIPQWDGSNISDKSLLVYAEQGIGDIIQFSRFLPAIRSYCRKLIVAVPPELIPLFRAFPASIIDEVVPRLLEKPIERDVADLCIPIVSPAAFMTGNGVPADPGYFLEIARAHPFDLIQPANPRALRIGIVWAGNPTHDRDRERSIALETLLPIAARGDVQCYSLQVGGRAGDVAMAGAQTLIYDLAPELTSWVVTASALLALDLVITVDTAVAHLAGALGVPVWLMVSTTPDWRWGPEAEGSDWYPSLRIWRQESIGDWRGVVARMLGGLDGFKQRSAPAIDVALPNVEAEIVDDVKPMKLRFGRVNRRG